MDEFCLRLLSFFEKGEEGTPGKWPLVSPTSEDMAGAGFKFAAAGSQRDNVKCDACNLECFKWEPDDNPYEDHVKNSPQCPFTKKDIFHQYRQIFELKANRPFTITPPITPGTYDASAGPKTPVRKSRRGKNTLSPVQTVADLKPRPSIAPPTSPLSIQIRGAGVSMDLEVVGNGVTDSPTKKRRMN